MPPLSQDTVEAVTAFFNYVDTDQDGYITIGELEEALAVDYDGNGVISPDEKVRAGAQWLNNGFQLQDVSGDSKLSLFELLDFNAA